MNKIIDELTAIIADRNNVPINERAFTAEDVAEYLICLRNQIKVCKYDVDDAIKDLFFTSEL